MDGCPLRAWSSSPKEARKILGQPPAAVFEFPCQTDDKVDVHSDTDWNGCVRTRKSTSGGCLMLGGHTATSSRAGVPPKERSF